MTARYEEIAGALRAAITRGDRSPGTLLDGERRLAEQYDVAVGTVRQALALLEREGVLDARQGARRVVVRPPEPPVPYDEFRSFAQWVRAQGREPGGSVITSDWAAATGTDRERLALDDADERVLLVVRLRRIDEEPVMVERTRYAPWLGRLVADAPADAPSVSTWLAEEHGVRFARARHVFGAAAAGTDDARLLGVRRGSPLLTHLRISQDRAGRPLEWAEDRYVAGTLALAVDSAAPSSALRWVDQR